MRKIKHSKYRNSGFLFELLVRQVTADILDESVKSSRAEKILKKYYHPSTELGRERKLYEILLKKKLNTEHKAEQFINLVATERRKLSEDKLKREKYALIKEIKDAYTIDVFMRNPISNYKTLASIYKVFESVTVNEMFDPSGIIDSKYTLIEHIITNTQQAHVEVDSLKEYKDQDKDTRILTYKILVERFNTTYSDLGIAQKKLLREYINNVADKQSFREYVAQQIPFIKKDLLGMIPTIKDEVTKIKLRETLNILDAIRSKKINDDKAASVLMLCYELTQEIKDVTRR